MRELNVNEVKEVNGGVGPWLILAAGYRIYKVVNALQKSAKAVGVATGVGLAGAAGNEVGKSLAKD